MTISTNTNLASQKAQGVLGRTTRSLSSVFERLSSGLRINHPGDDPAGIALADSLRADAKVAAVAVRNANDGLSVTSIADGALEQVGNILARMAELAEQSSNGVYANVQRSALQSEFVALGSEIERIAATTTFNDRYLLTGSEDINIQVGLTGAATSRIAIQGVSGKLDAIGLATSGSPVLTFSIISTSSTGAEAAAATALDAVKDAINSLSASRGKLGAAESRLSFAIDYIAVARENFIAAESRIRDVDTAQEVAEMVRLQVLQQAGTAVLAQANLQPQLALQLLS